LDKTVRTRAENKFYADKSRKLDAQVGFFGATMMVMGGIVGSGIFINPYVVAQLARTPSAILGAWVLGGALALAGAFIWAELAARLPKVGGQYAYLCEAYHPIAGFLYGWVSLLVISAGGTAAVAVTFAYYYQDLAGPVIPAKAVAIGVVLLLAVVNCLGVRLASGVQSILMVARIAAIGLLVVSGAWFAASHRASPGLQRVEPWHALPSHQLSLSELSIFCAALIPVMFAYGGWQTSSYIAEEIRDSRRKLPLAILAGVACVILLYVSVNIIYVRVLGPSGLAETSTPASAVARTVFGSRGAAWIASAIALSALGFLSQSALTYPRMYYAMASDGLLPGIFSTIGPEARVPVAAILLQAFVTIVVIGLGSFEQILSYVVVMDWLFFGLTACSIFVFRARERKQLTQCTAMHSPDLGAAAAWRVPLHPWTTTIFAVTSGMIVVNTIYKYPRNAGVAVCILFAGIPCYFLMRRGKRLTARDR
jgi:APA family basic amino acid/polyamine antiporter